MSAEEKDSAQSFETHRGHLTGLAYRMLGSVAEAQDAVQEAYLRWHQARGRESVENPRAFLSRTVTRLCLDQLKSARARREVYIGPWLPEPVLGSEELGAGTASEYAHDLSVALMLALERLSPLERAAFLLHDVFDMDFDEVARALGRKPDSCRQLASRARTRVRAARPRFRISQEECERIATAFGAAVRSGDAEAIAALLARDATYYSDGGGKVAAALRPVHGRDRIARLLGGLLRKTPLAGMRLVQINGLPGFVVELAAGRVLTAALDIREGFVTNLYVVANPEKLRHIPGVRGDAPASLPARARTH